MIVPLAPDTPLYECSDCGGVLTEGGRAVHEAWHAMIMSYLPKEKS